MKPVSHKVNKKNMKTFFKILKFLRHTQKNSFFWNTTFKYFNLRTSISAWGNSVEKDIRKEQFH